MTGGQAVVKALEKEGTSIVFGLPGVHVLAIYDALYDSKIRHILVRHEQSAAFMAFGAKGLIVGAIRQLKPCLEEALKADKPTVIDVRLPFDPPWGGEHYERKD